MKRWIWNVIGLVVGGLTVIAGIAVMASYAGAAPVMDVNGMDFYTMLYQASAYAAYNTLMMARTVSMGLGVLLISTGLAEVCFFGGRFMADWPDKKKKDPEDGPRDGDPQQPSLPEDSERASRAKLTGPTQENSAAQEVYEGGETADAPSGTVAEQEGGASKSSEKKDEVPNSVGGGETPGTAAEPERTDAESDKAETVAELGRTDAESDKAETAAEPERTDAESDKAETVGEPDLMSEAAEAEQALQDAVADAESAIRQAAEAAAALQDQEQNDSRQSR